MPQKVLLGHFFTHIFLDINVDKMVLMENRQLES